MKKHLLLFGIVFLTSLGPAFGQEFWERIYTLPDSCNRTYDIATNAQGDIFVATDKGLYKSSDYTETWESLWWERNHNCTALDISPNDRICFGTNYGSLYFSDDNGLSWEDVAVPHGGGGSFVYRVKYFGNDTIFALPTCLGSGAYVDYSFDGGNTWNYKIVGNWHLNYSTDITMSPDRTFYVCLGYMGSKEEENRLEVGGVFKSHDCMEWERVEISNSIENCFSAICYSPASKRIFVGDCEPLYKGNRKTKSDLIQLMYIYGCLVLDNNTVVTTSFLETGVSFDGGDSFSYFSDTNGGNRIIVGKDDHLYSTRYAYYDSNVRLSRSINPVDDLLKVTENLSNHEIQIFPNPATDQVNVFSETSNINLTVFSNDGALIESREVFNSHIIDVSRYKTGIYLFQISTNGITTTHKIIIK